MSALRIRRRPVPDVVESVPSRVRRTRPSQVVEEVAGTAHKARITRTRRPDTEEAAPIAVRRVRRAPEAPKYLGSRPPFLVDWTRPLSWKFSIYMVTSYLYYQMSKSVIPDSDFDQLCKQLDEGYDDFEHQHKHLVDRGQFSAGTGYDIKYPLMVKGAAEHMLQHYAER